MLGGSAGKAFTNLLYSGEQFDQRAAMQYLRARYYGAGSGRFAGLDPFAGIQTEPQRFHKYQYTHGNPINGIDPSGMTEGLIGALGTMATATTIGTLVGGGVGGVRAVGNMVTGRAAWDGEYFAMSIIRGALTGGLTGLTLSTGYISFLHFPKNAIIAGGVGAGLLTIPTIDDIVHGESIQGATDKTLSMVQG